MELNHRRYFLRDLLRQVFDVLLLLARLLEKPASVSKLRWQLAPTLLFAPHRLVLDDHGFRDLNNDKPLKWHIRLLQV